MRLQNALRLLSIGLLAVGLNAQSSAQSGQSKESGQGADRAQETTMTGCLSKDTAGGGYTLADERTGTKTAVTGPADLEKHSGNHKVSLTGTSKTEAGKTVFNVTKIQHISAECKAGQ